MNKLIELKYNLIPKDNIDILPIIHLYVDSIFNKSFEDIFLFILNNSIKKDYIFKFDTFDNSNVASICGYNSIEMEFNKIDSSKFASNRKHEYEFVRFIVNKKIRRYNSKAIVSLNPLKVYDSTYSKVIVEIDGCMIQYKNKKLYVTLMEAKQQKSKALSASKNALKDKLNKLNFYRDISPGIESIKNPSGSYIEFNVLIDD